MQPITHEDLTQWHRDGYIVLRELIPTAWLGDLRKQAAIAKEIIRAEQVHHGRPRATLHHLVGTDKYRSRVRAWRSGQITTFTGA